MKIYTKTGDRGETSLFGGQRVSKSHSRIDAYGTVDELNAVLGMIRSAKPESGLDRILIRIQQELFILGADLATPDDKNSRIERISKQHIQDLERDIDRLAASLTPIKSFILPGGAVQAASIHFARTVCRRAERCCISCREKETVSEEAIIYLNRLSDLLFIMARFQNMFGNIEDVFWKSR